MHPRDPHLSLTWVPRVCPALTRFTFPLGALTGHVAISFFGTLRGDRTAPRETV